MDPIVYPVDTLYNVARSILLAGVEVLEVNGVQVPTHRFVAWNAPAHDPCCDHLVAHVDVNKPSRGNSDRTPSAPTAFGVNVVLTLIGCVPVMDQTGNNVPTDTDLDLSAQLLLRQGFTLHQGLLCAYHSGELLTLPPDVPCQIVKMGDLVPHGPQGGCGSFTITFTVELA